MSTLELVSDCSAQRYCTQSDQALAYGNQYVLQWNNQYAPLNTESQVTVSVYSGYDLKNPIFSINGVSNVNGRISLTPEASWFSRYSGTNIDAGRDQQIYFAVNLLGNEPPAVNNMLPLRLTATPEQYQQILSIIHPSSTSETATSSEVSSTVASSASMTSDELRSSPSAAFSSKPTADTSTATMQIELSPSSSATENGDSHGRSGLSGGAIAGIVVGSALGLLLLILLLLLPMYRRRQRRKRMLSTSNNMDGRPPPLSSSSSTNSHPGGGSDAAVAAGAAAVGAAARHLGEKQRPDSASPSDTPLLLGGRPNNSFNSREGSLVDSQMSPKTAVYQPLNLDSPRVMMNMPPSTRSARDLSAEKPIASPDPILSTDDARQIGDIFRDALRKPPPVSEDGVSDSPNRESMLLHMDDELEEEEDPGWRERVASERMQRELEQEASVIRSVAMRAHGSDYSSSRPETSRSNSSLPN
ncbi:hypothetical protein BX667DRAFT_496639 [Coemansia mojavensis]|nr:hypothetical protein BX667DRAFT_496639 [Coemansia mojavensis]